MNVCSVVIIVVELFIYCRVDTFLLLWDLSCITALKGFDTISNFSMRKYYYGN